MIFITILIFIILCGIIQKKTPGGRTMKISGYLSFATLIEKGLPFYIATIGNPKYQPPVHRPLGIEDCQLLYTVSGEGCCFINGKSYIVGRGDLVYLPSGTPHEYHCSAGAWETLYITFNGTGLKGFFDFEPTVLTADSRLCFKERYSRLYELKRNPEMFKQASVELYSLLLSVREFTAPAAVVSGKKVHLMTRALHYMSDNRELSLGEIAAQFNISEEHFCRVFKQYTGFRPFEYLNLVKLQKAKELLKNTSLSIGEVCRESGFESHSYFSMLFRRSNGCTPGEYRKNNKNL